jgi:hypothetical protein
MLLIKLTKLANKLDHIGMYKLADEIDSILQKYATEMPDFSREKYEKDVGQEEEERLEVEERSPGMYTDPGDLHPSYKLYQYLMRTVEEYLKHWPEDTESVFGALDDIKDKLRGEGRFGK